MLLAGLAYNDADATPVRVRRSQGRIVWQQRYNGIAAVAYQNGHAIAGISGPWSDRYALIWWLGQGNLCTSVASEGRSREHGAQKPQHTNRYVRISSTGFARDAERSSLCRGSQVAGPQLELFESLEAAKFAVEARCHAENGLRPRRLFSPLRRAPITPQRTSWLAQFIARWRRRPATQHADSRRAAQMGQGDGLDLSGMHFNAER